MPFMDKDIEVRARGTTHWEVLKAIRYHGREEGFIVHAGFETDFASVPRGLVWLIPKYGRFTAAAILHDFLWAQCRDGRFNWFDADGIFRRAMREDGVPFAHRWLMWGAVRLGVMRHAPFDPFSHGVVQSGLFLAVAGLGAAFVAVPFAVVSCGWCCSGWASCRCSRSRGCVTGEPAGNRSAPACCSIWAERRLDCPLPSGAGRELRSNTRLWAGPRIGDRLTAVAPLVARNLHKGSPSWPGSHRRSPCTHLLPQVTRPWARHTLLPCSRSKPGSRPERRTSPLICARRPTRRRCRGWSTTRSSAGRPTTNED